MLDELDAARSGMLGEASRHPRRLDGSVGRMEDRGLELPVQRRFERLSPLDPEAVFAQCLVFEPQLVPLFEIGGETETADSDRARRRRALRDA